MIGERPGLDPATASRRARRQRFFLALSLAGSVLAGLGLRLWNLRNQVMGGDELHLVRSILARTLPEILTTYPPVDTSIPLTALYRVLFAAGTQLSEIDFRLPALLCGCLAVIVLPWTFAHRLDRPVVLMYAWLLAISPCLVLYSRIARSYLPMVLCGFGAVMAFEAWWRTRAWKFAALYVGLGALAAWIHLGAAPLVAAPCLFAAGDLIVRRGERWQRLRDLVVVGIGLTLGFAAFLLPARESLLRLIALKHRDVRIPKHAIWNVLRLEAGTPSTTIAILFWIAALAGLVLLLRDPLRDHRRLGAFTATVAAGQILGIRLLSPLGANSPLILNRYLLPVLPFVLLWVAYGLGRLWNRKAAGCAGWAAQRYAVRIFVLLLFWTGPFLSPGFRDSSFMHHNDFVGFWAPRASLPDALVPEAYRHLPRGPVVEYPWPAIWEFGRTFYIYQRVHDRRVIGASTEIPWHPQIRFRNALPPDPQAFLASPARTLVVHVRLPWEEDRVQTPGRRPWRIPAGRRRANYRRAGERLARRLTAEWGPPDAGDDTVRVWDLERVRKGQQGQ